MSPSTTYIATLAAAPITEVDYAIINTVAQADLLRRYPTYQQSFTAYQPMSGIRMSLSEPERNVGYAIDIEALKVTVTAPAGKQRDIQTPFTTQLTRELTQLIRQLERALQADRLRAALTAQDVPVRAELVTATRAKFAGEAVALRLGTPLHGVITFVVYAGGYIHALMDAADQLAAEKSVGAFLAFAQERQLPLTLNALKPFTAERLVIEPLHVELTPFPDWLMRPAWETYHAPKGYYRIEYPASWTVEDGTPHTFQSREPDGKTRFIYENCTAFHTKLRNLGANIDVKLLDNPPDPNYPFTPNTTVGGLPAMRDPSEGDKPSGRWYVAYEGVGFEISLGMPVMFMHQPFPYQDYGLPAPTPAESAAVADSFRQMLDSFHAPDTDVK